MRILNDYEKRSGAVLREFISDGELFFEYADEDRIERYSAYRAEKDVPLPERLYLGHTLDEVLQSGRDILGEEILKNGEPEYSDIVGVLPRLTEDSYCFLGGEASHGSLTVDGSGKVYPQWSGREPKTDEILNPSYFDERLENIAPRQVLLGEKLPILFNLFNVDGSFTEMMYFVTPTDTDRDPVLFVRVRKYRDSIEGIIPDNDEFYIVSANYLFKHSDRLISKIERDTFYTELTATVGRWTSFINEGARFSLPDKRLGTVSEGAIISLRTTFTGPRPHYGHKYYGIELHDNFPPNYIWSIEGLICSGHLSEAREIFNHLLRYGLTDEGRFAYWQGPLLYSSSAAEYGMMLWLSRRYSDILMPKGLDKTTSRKLSMMGDVILEHFVICPEFDGLKLIKMCAEADNSVRVNVYLNNNLWSVRGLRSLSYILGSNGKKYSDAADTLWQNINLMIEKHSVVTERYGIICPFRFGYPPVPYTLSNCDETSVPLTEKQHNEYFITTYGRRDFDAEGQELTENTYSNYRYLAEILSSMLLSSDIADGINKMRDLLGGKLLSMTRFRTWINDWPVVNYARFLIETKRINEFLLLLYSHTEHHGRPELCVYYEQVNAYGKVSAHDCVPSLLTTPILTSWLFLYETVEGELQLLPALPLSWLGKAFSAKGIGYSRGFADFVSDGEYINISLSSPTRAGDKIVLREGLRFLDASSCSIRQNASEILLSEGITEIRLRILS